MQGMLRACWGACWGYRPQHLLNVARDMGSERCQLWAVFWAGGLPRGGLPSGHSPATTSPACSGAGSEGGGRLQGLPEGTCREELHAQVGQPPGGLRLASTRAPSWVSDRLLPRPLGWESGSAYGPAAQRMTSCSYRTSQRNRGPGVLEPQEGATGVAGPQEWATGVAGPQEGTPHAAQDGTVVGSSLQVSLLGMPGHVGAGLLAMPGCALGAPRGLVQGGVRGQGNVTARHACPPRHLDEARML